MLIAKLQKKISITYKWVILNCIFLTALGLTGVLIELELDRSFWHMLVLISILLIAAISLVMSGLLLSKINRLALPQVREELEHANQLANFWQHENEVLIRNLALTIQQQFSTWGLSKAECEIAFLLLKGYSLKEIAALRSTSERTVREQAIHIYAKSGLKSRTELTAFFLEDLLNPVHQEVEQGQLDRT